MELEFDIDEREREYHNMIIEVDGMKIEIPENLIEERMNLIGLNKEEVFSMILNQAKDYKQCLIINKTFDKNTFSEQFIEFLDGELSIYRL